jgi:hypothetical protein
MTVTTTSSAPHHHRTIETLPLHLRKVALSIFAQPALHNHLFLSHLHCLCPPPWHTLKRNFFYLSTSEALMDGTTSRVTHMRTHPGPSKAPSCRHPAVAKPSSSVPSPVRCWAPHPQQTTPSPRAACPSTTSVECLTSAQGEQDFDILARL